MSKTKDMTGQRFGRLVVLRREGSTPDGKAKWRCLCDCGNEVVVIGADLRNKRSKSCGCRSIDVARACMTTHAESGTRLYKLWCSMKRRCYNPHDKSYYRYGRRGITICEEWRNDFQAFYDWAMANGYDENAPKGQCTIDRIDNDKGYGPDNCRWTDMKTQCNNRSRSGPLLKTKRSKTNDCN